MNYVSLPRISLGAQWRPTPGGELGSWQPSVAELPAETAPRALGQTSLTLPTLPRAASMVAAAGTAVVGFGMAIWGPKDSPTWRWLGGLAGAIGTMRLLHDVSKI